MFTHTSWAPDRASSYERLEFLGDSVLELAIARALYDRFPDASEGRLAKIRAHVVSRHSCAAVAKELDLVRFLLEQAQDVPGAELDRISRSRNVLAALLEAAIAARLPGARLRAGRAGRRGGVRLEDRVRPHRSHRQQDRAAGGPRAFRQPGAVRGDRRRGAAARPPVRVRGGDRRRAGRDRQAARRRRPPSRRPPARHSRRWGSTAPEE